MMLRLRRFSVLVSGLILLGCVLPAAADWKGGDRRHSQDDTLFSAADYIEHVGTLASDELEGRGTGQVGIDRAAEYIVTFFEQRGVDPAGDDGTYFQEFPLAMKNSICEDTRLAIGLHGRRTRRPACLHDDYVPFPFSKTGPFKGDVVFAGYGIVREDLDYNDYADVDVAGKVVLLLRHAPDFGDFTNRDMSFRVKATRANGRDAAAVLIVNRPDDEENQGLYDFDGGPRGFFGFSRRASGVPMLHITQETADRMLEAADLPDLATLQQKIDDNQAPVSAPLTGVSVKGFIEIEPVDSPARNVVGMIPGQGENADEFIVLGAHYDHLGITSKGEASFDSEIDIFNGADDNASGTALVMAMADAYTQGAAPNRSILLILFAAEEMGLVGSRHFVDHPTINLDDCVAMLNFDMVGRLRDNRLKIGGMRTGEFEDMVERLAEPYGLEIDDAGGGRGPSDHMSFYNKDIPVLFFFTGLHPQYHQADDDTVLINADGAVGIAKFAADVLDEIDAAAERPEFHKDSRNTVLWFTSDEADSDSAAPKAPRPVRLGVRIAPDDERGLRVGRVSDDSPAARAGLEDGDRIIELEGVAIDSREDLIGTLAELKDGDRATLVVLRGDELIELIVQFGEAPKVGEGGDEAPPDTGAQMVVRGRRIRLGVRLRPVPGDAPIVVSVIEDTPADRAGVQADDRITRIGKKSIASVEDIGAALDLLEDGEKTTIIVEREDGPVELSVQFGKVEQAPAGDDAQGIAREVAELVARQVAGLFSGCAVNAVGSIRARAADEQIEFEFGQGDLSQARSPEGSGQRPRLATVLTVFLKDVIRQGHGSVAISVHIDDLIPGSNVGLDAAFTFDIPAEAHDGADIEEPDGSAGSSDVRGTTGKAEGKSPPKTKRNSKSKKKTDPDARSARRAHRAAA